MKSVLSAIPQYKFRSCYIPLSVLLEINKILRSFLLGRTKINTLDFLGTYKLNCSSFSNRGVELRDAKWFYKALIGKQTYKLFTSTDSLWTRIVRAKYPISSISSPLRNCSWTWRAVWHKNSLIKDNL